MMPEYKFENACKTGELEIAKKVLLENPEKINISVMETGFKKACQEGYLDIAQWILSIKPDRDVLVTLETLSNKRMDELTEEGMDPDYFVDDQEYQIIELCIDFIKQKK